jgi:hypothetical protein
MHGGGMIQRLGDGFLRLSSATIQSSAGCVRNGQPWSDGGVIVEIEFPVTAFGVYIALLTHTGPQASMLVVDGMLKFQPETGGVWGTVSFDADKMRWWRMRPTATAVIAETSEDGSNWSLLGTSPDPPAATIDVDITVGRTGAGLGGTGRFGRVIVCQ